MRRRGIPLVVLTVLLLAALSYLLRTWSMEHKLREHDDLLLHQDAAAIAVAVHERTAGAKPVDRDFLRSLIGQDMGVRVHAVDGSDLQVRNAGYDGSLDPTDDNPNLWATASIDDYGYVLLGEDDHVMHDTVWQDRTTLLLAALVVGVLAAIVAALLARAYERPFLRLADAAAELGRGRFQLDLPRSRVPAANAIGQALALSAQQLQDRMATEEELAQRASHVLRTPLTGLRLELEEIAIDDGLSPDAAAALARSLQRVDQLDAVTGELAAFARHRALVAEAAIELGVLARQIAQRWAEELAVQQRRLSTAVEGEDTITYTPGPVEHILELLLADVVHRTAGDVRLVFATGSASHLRISIRADSAVPVRKGNTAPLLRARTIAAALGGRLDGEYAMSGVEIVLPRR
jgi:signal transduction histidine kinase